MTHHDEGSLHDGAATRARLAALADRLLAAARRHASPGHGQILLPGPEGGYGRQVDGLEGFVRTLLLAGFRLAGERGEDPDNLAEFYARGIATGVDPKAADRWPRMSEHAQAKVEAASLALVLDLTRPWLWDRLVALTQERVVDYLAECVGDQTYPRCNWIWFRIVAQTFLRSVGGPWSGQDIADDLAAHDSWYHGDGWYSDGDERAFDHYGGWAMHLYPALWARMRTAEREGAARRATDHARLDRFLQDAVTLVGADGSPLLQGRSLIYRFAAAAPFWVGAIDEVPSVSPGLLRTAGAAVVEHFTAHGVPGEDGLLTTGWHHEWRPLAQSYSGTGSPYWASKGMLGLALPADHPVWTAPAEPLPVQSGDVLRAAAAPGWIISGTRSDGVVRVVNHGTDHALPGSSGGDSPLYARLGYSTATATSPLLDGPSWESPAEGSVALVATAGEHQGRATHRAGMELLAARVSDGVGVAASRAAAHWLVPGAEQVHHGSGRLGTATDAGTLTVVSMVRGAWEVRLARVEALADGVAAADVRLRVSGWPVVDGDGLASVVGSLAGRDTEAASAGPATALATGEGVCTDASPLCLPGGKTRAPWAETVVVAGEWFATAVGLGRDLGVPPALTLAGGDAVVTWPDGRTSSTTLPA